MAILCDSEIKAAIRYGHLIIEPPPQAEHEELRQVAEAAGLSLSMWVRTVALERARG